MMGRTLLLLFICYVPLLTVAAAQICTVDTITSQENFDFHNFTGKWYLIRRHDTEITSLTDYTHNYLQTGNERATVYTQGRNPLKQGKCERSIQTLVTTETPGKLRLTQDGLSSPYWVLETDYTQYAFVYGCYDVSDNGTCSGARAWIWSRTPSLPQNVLDRTSTFYQNICIEEGRFEMIDQNNECGVMTHWRLRDGKDCNVNNIQVTENFDIEKYAGTWYETRWLAPFYIPPNQLFQDYQHHYVITADGNITGYVYGRSPDNPDQCFYNEVHVDVTSSPGKMIYRYKNEPDVPYWVLRTDYTQYAVVYGCFNVSSDGSCYQARSWVWSRTPTLPNQLQYEINTLLQNNCINPSAYLNTEQNKECPHQLEWSVSDKRDCNVTKFNLSTSLTKDKTHTSIWYNVMSVPGGSTSANREVTDYQTEIFTDDQGNTFLYNRFRQRGQCTYSKDMQKKTVQRYAGSQQADADYDTYVVMYECDQVGSDGGCLSPRGSVWSTTPSLAPQEQYRVNSILQELCLNPAAFLTPTNKRHCPPQEVLSCPTETGSAGETKQFLFLVFIAQLCVGLI